jgi:hypothetical protein
MNRKHFYSVLLEYPEPELNIFAIYDQDSRFYLLDKSLNGNITMEWAQKGTKNFCFVQERFLTKDVLNIERLSMYLVKDTTAELVYRELSKMVSNGDTISHSVIKIADDKVVTRINSKNDLNNNSKSDTFYLNSSTGKYLSRENIFKNFVKKEINNFRWIPIKPQLVKSIYSEEMLIKGNGFQISLNDNWKKTPDFTHSKYLRTNLTGDHFTNETFESNISILPIPNTKNAEDYCRYVFGKLTEGKYKMRSTKMLNAGNYMFQIAEHSCGELKFLFIFESTNQSYEKNKIFFDDIINSFFIECR